MRELYAIFAGELQHGVPLSGGSDVLHAHCFLEARQSGTVGAREVIALWRVDKSTTQEHVIEIFGRVPTDIQARYDAWKAAHPQH